LASSQPEPALASASNLVALARAYNSSGVAGAKRGVATEALEELVTTGKTRRGLRAESRAEVPVEWQRPALLKIAELALARAAWLKQSIG
jgi:hypothetical protein